MQLVTYIFFGAMIASGCLFLVSFFIVAFKGAYAKRQPQIYKHDSLFIKADKRMQHFHSLPEVVRWFKITLVGFFGVLLSILVLGVLHDVGW